VTGFSTDYVNQIAINLRDRYKSGFPILKELVQNADDAGATNLVFGYHPGHGDAADHMLLRGPALWVLNDGEFKPLDRRSIRSFGLNAKAGDSGVIGKFGLGMKSVFHLCESFLYVAYHGGELIHDVLNPWKTEDADCAAMHLQWEQVTSRDVECIASVAREQPEASRATDWFILWVPLRQRSHVPREPGRPAAAIIERYPGENPDEDLDFFSDPRTDQRIGALLPLLKNLERVRFAGASMRQPFTVTLEAQPAGKRLNHENDAVRIHGVVRDDRPRAEQMHVLVRQRVPAEAESFATLRAAGSWPTSMVITASGRREPQPDKTIAEAALMFAHANGRSGRLILQWAVFLPADEQRCSYEAVIAGSSREYRIVLHGQFFVDAGRRGIADMEALDRPREPLPSGELSQHVVIRHWNQALAQDTVLPEFLPALADYVTTTGLKDEEVAELTAAIARCAAVGDAGSRVDFFPAFRSFMCKRYSWVRRLLRTGARWELVESSVEQLLALPTPPARDPQRPWRVFPGLAQLGGYAFIDAGAPYLASAVATWEPELLLRVLTELRPETLKGETDLDYLAGFLEQERLRYVRAGEVQDALVVQLRSFLLDSRLAEVRQHRKIFKRIVALLTEDRVFGLGPVDPSAKGAIPERFLRKILASPTRALPLPADLAPDGVDGKPHHTDLLAWLHALTRNDSSGTSDRDSSSAQVLDAAERIIRAAGDDAEQVALLRQCTRLKVLRAMRGNDGEVEAVSLVDLMDAHARGWLFRVSDVRRPLGFVPKLSKALPALGALVVRSAVAGYADAVRDSSAGRVPGAESVEAILRCSGAEPTAPELGSEIQRSELLTLVATARLDDPSVVRGVRYLLHGSAEHYLGTEVLWKDPVGQNSPWVRLWRMIDESPWRVLADRLCSSIPDRCAQPLNVRAVDEASVLNRLRVCSDFSRVDAAAFSSGEIDLVMGRVAEEHPWRHLPLHRDTAGRTGTAEGDCFLGDDPPLPDTMASGIRFIEPSADADHLKRQRQWIPSWNAATAADRVLSSREPGQHWRYLMDLLATSPALRTKPPVAWAEVPWLPLQGGGFISIGSLIRLANLDAEIRDLARRCAYAFASPRDLSSELQSHPAFTTLLDRVCEGEAALPVLGQLMSAAELSVGRVVAFAYRDLQQHISTLVAIDALPAWKLLERAAVATSPDAVEKHLVPEVSLQLSTDSCRRALTQISSLGQSKAVPVVFEHYLREWRGSAGETELRRGLFGLRLLSKAGTWVPAEELVAGVHGVSPESLLCDAHVELLRDVAIDNRSLPQAEPASESDDSDAIAGEQLLRELEEYVEPLATSGAKQAVGALIGLFGERAAALAKTWLDPIDYEDYLAKLGWRDPGYDTVAQRWKWMSRKSVREALATLSIRIHVVSGSHITANSLTGESKEVRLAPVEDLQTLHVMTDRWRGFSCRVHFLPASVLLERELQDQRDVLMRTCESLLRGLYNQKHANLSEFFALAEEADQVTLDVARGLILDGLPQSLRSLPGIGKNRKLADALGRLDQARRAAASAKRARRTGGNAEEELEKALEDLAGLVESDDSVQATVLAGIRTRVTHNQYEFSSIPFEVFQNADDAVVEMQLLQHADGRPEFDADAIGRFVMQSSDGTIRFVHWGRPINYAGRHTNYRSEFGNDLERMLMLGASAKDEEEGVTGKFGLGFKSLLLASSLPRVSSADLSFEVVAGCLPRKWKASAATSWFHRSIGDASQKALRATLIELPLDDKGSATEVVARFGALAGLLPVFARKLVCVDVEKESHGWRPRRLRLSGGRVIEAGAVALPVDGGRIHSGILVFRGPSGCVVMRTGKAGTEEYDRKAKPPVPGIWVTAPTRGTPARGVLINASFQIDTGRATLALGQAATATNIKIVEAIAYEVGPVLVDLLADSQSDWPQLAERLGLSSSVSAAEFWRGLWEKLVGEAPGEDAAMDVRLLDVFGCAVLRHVVERTGVIANGFAAARGDFVRLRSLTLSVNPGYLSGVLPVLLQWPFFMERFPVDSWCTELVRGWIERIGLVREGEIPSLGMAQVLGCLRGGCLPPSEIRALSSILRLWPSNLGESSRWREAAAGLLLCARNGAWVPAKTLIGRLGAEDELLARFAPDSVVLHPDYVTSGRDFVYVEEYLPHRQPDASSVAEWCVNATTSEQRSAVVVWLIRNLYGSVIDVLRSHRKGGGWLFDLQEDSSDLQHLSVEERRLLLSVLGLVASAPDPFTPLTPRLDLHTIHGWWAERGEVWLRKFDERLWPASVDRSALKAEPVDRNAWMTLFSLGVFRRYGRVTDQQHRGFIEFLNSRGWWRTICDVDPALGADAWLGILRAYAEERQTDTLFELWMDSFPRLYRVARWLSEYVHLFQTLDRRESSFAKFLLSPASDPSLSGSGIEAPTLSGILRLGQHLVIRELLRSDVLSSQLAKQMAFAPRSSVIALMAGLGHGNLQASGDIFRVLVEELGAENACFGGAYDIPLQLLATDSAAARDVERWADGKSDDDAEDWEAEL
jgi:hypothetical protein